MRCISLLAAAIAVIVLGTAPARPPRASRTPAARSSKNVVGKSVKGTVVASNVNSVQAQYANCGQAKKALNKMLSLRIEKPKSVDGFRCTPAVHPTEPDVVAYNCLFRGADTPMFVSSSSRSPTTRTEALLLPGGGRSHSRQGGEQRHHDEHPAGRGHQEGADRGDREEDHRDQQGLPAPPVVRARRGRSGRRRGAPSGAAPRPARASRRAGRGTRCGRSSWRRSRRIRRLFADVVPELFLAHLRERLVGFRSRIALRRPAARGSARAAVPAPRAGRRARDVGRPPPLRPFPGSPSEGR